MSIESVRQMVRDATTRFGSPAPPSQKLLVYVPPALELALGRTALSLLTAVLVAIPPPAALCSIPGNLYPAHPPSFPTAYFGFRPDAVVCVLGPQYLLVLARGCFWLHRATPQEHRPFGPPEASPATLSVNLVWTDCLLRVSCHCKTP